MTIQTMTRTSPESKYNVDTVVSVVSVIALFLVQPNSGD